MPFVAISDACPGMWRDLIQVPFILQRAIDRLNNPQLSTALMPTAIFMCYGLARAGAVLCQEIKTTIFAYVSQVRGSVKAAHFESQTSGGSQAGPCIGTHQRIIHYCRQVRLTTAACLCPILSQSALRQYALSIFVKLHQLDSGFHQTHPTGLLSVAFVSKAHSPFWRYRSTDLREVCWI